MNDGAIEVVAVELERDKRAERITRLIGAAQNKHTIDAKEGDLRQLAAWQESQGDRAGLPLDAEEFLRFLDFLAYEATDARTGRVGFAPSTVSRKAASVSAAHRALGLATPIDHPAVTAWFRGLLRTSEPQEHARPLRIEQVIEVVRRLSRDEKNEAIKLRDRAVLLLGFAGALRRSELAALNVGDFELAPRGAILHIRRSKTDQEGVGAGVPIHRRAYYCPVGAVLAWLELRARLTGRAIEASAPLFVGVHYSGALRKGGPKRGERMAGRTVDAIVKARCEAVGLLGFSAHSLRAGYCVSAREAGATEFAIRRVTRHRSPSTLHRYFSGAGTFDEDPFTRFDESGEEDEPSK